MTGSIAYSGVAPGKAADAAGVHLGSMVRIVFGWEEEAGL